MEATEETTFYTAGREAAERREKIQNSAIRFLRVGSDAWEEFIAGYDSVKPKTPKTAKKDAA